MPAYLTPEEMLDKFFLDLRNRAIDLAAGLDRLAVAHVDTGRVPRDARLAQLKAALSILADEDPDKAERMQLAFSDPYDASWRKK